MTSEAGVGAAWPQKSSTRSLAVLLCPVTARTQENRTISQSRSRPRGGTVFSCLETIV